jgi:hypothetical protein
MLSPVDKTGHNNITGIVMKVALKPRNIINLSLILTKYCNNNRNLRVL